MFKYSIIIPVYNAEKFLKNCVQSILKQTYENYEIILIDDGSKDSSPQICDELKAEYPDKFKVVHCENGGTASARNVGLSVAEGDYIGFMDNDDFWRFDDALYEINAKLSASKADMLVYGTAVYHEDKNNIVDEGNTFNEKMILGKSCYDAVREMIKCSFINFTVWSKFVKRTIITENNILFPKNMRNEDTDWLAKVFAKIDSVDAYGKFLYAYRKGNDYSQTSKPLQRKHVDDLKEILVENIKMASQLEADRRDMVYDFLCQAYVVWMSQIALFDNIKSDIKEMKKYKYILKKGSKPYIKSMRLFSAIFGFRLTIKVLNLLLIRKYPFIKESGKS